MCHLIVLTLVAPIVSLGYCFFFSVVFFVYFFRWSSCVFVYDTRYSLFVSFLVFSREYDI